MMASSMTVAGGGNWRNKQKNNNNSTPMPGIDTSYAGNTPGTAVTPSPTPVNPYGVTNGAGVSSPGLTPTNDTVAMEFEQYVDTTYAGNGMIVGGTASGANATEGASGGGEVPKEEPEEEIVDSTGGGDFGGGEVPKEEPEEEIVDSTGGGDFGGGEVSKEEPEEEVVDSTGGGDFGGGEVPKEEPEEEVVDSTGGGDFGGGEVPKEEPEEEVDDSTGEGASGGGEVPKEEPEEEVVDSNAIQQQYMQSFVGMSRADGSPMVVTDENGNLVWNPEPEKEVANSTGDGASGGGEVPKDDEPSYAESTDYLKEYYEGAEQREQEKRETSYEANAQIKESTIKTADASRDRAIVDARSSAELRESSYGANAEAFASMGLSSSGYKDYYDSVSYAQMREETQYANAQFDAAQRAAIEQETVANKEADLRYETNMDANAKEYAAYMQNKNNEDSATRTNNFNTAYNMVRNGDSVDSAVTWLASQGITLNDSEMAALEQAWSDYSTEKADIDAMTNADKFTSIYNSVANGSIDLAGAQNLAAKYGITLSEADIAMLQGAIDRHQAGVAKSDNAYKMDVLGSFYNQILNGMSVEEAMAAIEGYGIALSESDKTYLNGAAGRYANNKADLDEREANAQALNFLSMAKSGEWSAEELAVLAEKAGLGVAYTTTEINENGEEVTREVTWAEFIGDVARATAAAQGDEEKQNSLIKITELAVNGVSAGALELMAGALGIDVSEIQGAIDFANEAAAEKTAAQQKATAYQLMGFAESGKLSAEELASLAAMEGLDQVVAYTKDGEDVTYADIISGIAERMQQEQTEAELKSLGYQYMEWAKNGTFSAEELASLAAMEGLDKVVAYTTEDGKNVTWGDIISELAQNTAEVTMKGYKTQLLDWLDGTGGRSSAFIESMAEMWGLSDDPEISELITKRAEEEAKQIQINEASVQADILSKAESGAISWEVAKALMKAYDIDISSEFGTKVRTATRTAAKSVQSDKVVSLIAEASNGASAATIKALAEAMGLEEGEYEAAMNIATELETKRQNSAYAELASQIGDDAAAIDAMVAAGTISEEQGISLKRTVLYNEIMNDIYTNDIFADMSDTNGFLDTGVGKLFAMLIGVDMDGSKVVLTDDQKKELKKEWNAVAQDKLGRLITSAQGGDYPSEQDMQRMIEALENSYVNDSTKEKFVNLIKELMGHNPVTFKKKYGDIDFSAFVDIDYSLGVPVIVTDDGGRQQTQSSGRKVEQSIESPTEKPTE